MARKPKEVTKDDAHEVSSYLLYDMAESSFKNYSQAGQDALVLYKKEITELHDRREAGDADNDEYKYLYSPERINVLMDNHFTANDRNKVWAFFRKKADLKKRRESGEKCTSISFNESEMKNIKRIQLFFKSLTGNEKMTQSQAIAASINYVLYGHEGEITGNKEKPLDSVDSD